MLDAEMPIGHRDLLRGWLRVIDGELAPLYTAPQKRVFLCTNGVVQSFSNQSRIWLPLIKVGAFLAQVVENAKSYLLSRQARAHFAIAITTSVEGDIKIDLFRGTITIVGESMVHKIHVHDRDWFFLLHSSMRSVGTTLCLSVGTALVTPRYVPFTRLSLQKSEILSLLDQIRVVGQQAPEVLLQHPDIKPAGAIARIARQYGMAAEHVLPYQRLALQIEQKALRRRFTLVHGDFWLGNIMDDAGEVKLIDFDKCMLFSKSYDIIYFYIFDLLKTVRGDLRAILKQHADICSDVTLKAQEILGTVSRAEVELNVLMIVLLKATEQDVSNGTVGKSLNLFDGLL